MKQIKTVLLVLLVIFLVAVIAYSGYQIGKINNDYVQESKLHEQIETFKPSLPQSKTDNPVVHNQGILDLQELNEDVIGWLTIPDTEIDYPFVWYSDNDYYLRRDLNKNAAAAGTIFMDYRCAKDFSSENTILYGHHMKNNSMFGSLKLFNAKTFFDSNKYGTIHLPRQNYVLQLFAYLVTSPEKERELYNVSLRSSYLDYVKKNARHYRDIGLRSGDKIVTLSTCAYEFDNARTVLIGRLHTGLQVMED